MQRELGKTFSKLRNKTKPQKNLNERKVSKILNKEFTVMI